MKNDSYSVSSGKDHDGYMQVMLENDFLRVKYQHSKWMKEDEEKHSCYIREFLIKSRGVNVAGRALDDSAHRQLITLARAKEEAHSLDGNAQGVTTLDLEWGDGDSASEVTLWRDLPVLEIRYLRWRHNVVDGGYPGAPAGTYVVYGAESWKRDYPLYPLVYFCRTPQSIGHENVTGIDEPGPLSYRGWFIMGVYDPASGVGFGRVSSVEATDIIKLIFGRGFETFPCCKREHSPHTQFLFAVTHGKEEVLTLGKQIVDRISAK